MSMFSTSGSSSTSCTSPAPIHRGVNGDDQAHVVPGVGGQFPAGGQKSRSDAVAPPVVMAHRQLVLIRLRQLRLPADFPLLLGPGHLIGRLLPQQADQLVVDADFAREPMPSIVGASAFSMPASPSAPTEAPGRLLVHERGSAPATTSAPTRRSRGWSGPGRYRRTAWSSPLPTGPAHRPGRRPGNPPPAPATRSKPAPDGPAPR